VAEALEPTMEQIAQGVLASRLQHADETGVRLGGKLHWMHVNSTPWLTHLAWHRKRGREALEAIGIWPRFQGRSMRDRWASYDRYRCLHSICGAHVVRDLTYEHEQLNQAWAGELKEVLLGMHAAACEWRERGATCLPTLERDEWVSQYFDVLAHGFAAQPPPSGKKPPSDREDASRPQVRICWMTCCDEPSRCWPSSMTCGFLLPTIKPNGICGWSKSSRRSPAPFVVTQASRPFVGSAASLRTMRKQGQAMLAALAAVFADRPLPIAWEL
jgi:transposase